MLSTLLACFTIAAQSPAADRDALIDGVERIAAPGAPGSVLALRAPAQPVVVGGVGKSGRASVVAIARWERGRVVALGHSGYLDPANLSQFDTARLLDNAIAWCAQGRPKAQIRIVAVDADLATWLRERGYPLASTVRGTWTTEGVDVVISSRADMSAPEQARLATFIKAGGGLIEAQTGWGWKQIHHDADMRIHPPSVLLHEAGLVWTDDMVTPTRGRAFSTAEAPSPLLRFDTALDALFPTGHEPVTQDPQAGLTVTAGIELLADDDTTTRPRLDALLAARAKQLIISPERPLPATRPSDRALVAYQRARSQSLAPRDVRGDPSAAHFPGALPPNAPTEPADRTIDLRVPGWHSLGLWAPAGAVVTVEVTNGLAPTDASVQIGSHTDRLWALDTWTRSPEITVRTRLAPPSTSLASAFGGLIYLDVPRAGSGSLSIRVKGAAAAPLFVLGETDPAFWREHTRLAPGPWAELATSKVIVTIPSEQVRALEDPRPVLELWDQVLDACADLASRPRARARPERYVADVQISAGYMHSGYPIMTHLDAAASMCDVTKLKSGSWGLFHEMGHNHQESAWTFDGTTEVTCNWFSLYVMETVCGKTPVSGHEAIDHPKDRSARTLKFRREGAAFERWKSDPFLALELYIQIREAFGWEPFKHVTAAARALTPGSRPHNDDQERDWSVIAFSQATGHDLGPHFASFGVPISPWARSICAHLPAWVRTPN